MGSEQTVLIDSGQWNSILVAMQAQQGAMANLITVCTVLMLASFCILFFGVIAATRRSR